MRIEKMSSNRRGYSSSVLLAALAGGKEAFLTYLLTKTGGTCWICGTVLTRETVTPDHVIPRIAQRRFPGRNLDSLHNIQPACWSCNNARGARYTIEDILRVFPDWHEGRQP